MFFSLPVHLLRQYCFCPRIPWFQELLAFRPPHPLWVQQGEAFDVRQQQIFRHRTLKRFALEQAEQRFHVPLASDSLRMHGRMDCLLRSEDRMIPVEIKLAGKKPDRGHILQITAYGMLLSEQEGVDVPQGFILMNQRGKTWPIALNAERKSEVCKIRDAILTLLEQANMPESSASMAQCSQCEYLNYCNDR